MTEHLPGDSNAGDRYVRLDDGDMHVVEDGKPGAPAALDRLGVSRVTVVGHSSGCTVATALAEQRPDEVAGLALIDMGPSPDAKVPERLIFVCY